MISLLKFYGIELVEGPYGLVVYGDDDVAFTESVLIVFTSVADGGYDGLRVLFHVADIVDVVVYFQVVAAGV